MLIKYPHLLDTFLLILGILLLILGFVGSILPFLPGPPLAYLSFICLQLSSHKPFSTSFLIGWALMVCLVLLLDYLIPIWGTKRFGGTKGGTWGANIGLIAGMFLFPPFGLILGPLVGAFAGELLNKQEVDKALRSALGSFLGFLAGTLMKSALCVIMAFLFIRAVW